MKIIKPSARIMTELDKMSLAQRIEACGRLCYKSEGKVTTTSAEGFAGAMVKHRHNSTLEMAPVSFLVECDEHEHTQMLSEAMPKYLVVDRVRSVIRKTGLLVSGTVRAFREFAMTNPQCAIGRACLNELPEIFKGDLSLGRMPCDCDIRVTKLRLDEVDVLPSVVKARHRQVTVKFIVNRAVTHEIVRHRPCSFLQESQRYCRYDKDQFGNEVTFIKPIFFVDDSEEYLLWQQAMEQTERIYLKLLETSSPQAARTVLPNSCKTEIIMQANLVEWEHFFHLRCSEAAEPSMREVTIPLRERFCTMFPQHSFDRRMPEGWIEEQPA